MKKICPICDQELTEDLWCQHCNRKVALYKTISETTLSQAGMIPNAGEERLRMELQQRFVTSLNALILSKSRAYSQTRISTAKKEPSGNIPPVPQRPVSRPASLPAQLPEKRQSESAGAFKAIAAAMLVSLIVTMIVTMPLLLHLRTNDDRPKHPVNISATVASSATDQIGSSGVEAASHTDSSEEPSEAFDNASASHETSQGDELSEDSLVEDSLGEIPSEEALSPEELYLINQEKLSQLSPILVDTYGGDYIYYYYAARDIRKLGVECTYYHIRATRRSLLPLLDEYFSDVSYAVEQSDDLPDKQAMYNNYYASDFASYYTVFQSYLDYQAEDFSCYLNYDTGSDNLHFLSLYGDQSCSHLGLIHTVLQTVSSEYDVGEDEFWASALRIISELTMSTSGSAWGEARIYEDSLASVSAIYHGGDVEIQINSRAFTDDMEMNSYGAWTEKE